MKVAEVANMPFCEVHNGFGNALNLQTWHESKAPARSSVFVRTPNIVDIIDFTNINVDSVVYILKVLSDS